MVTVGPMTSIFSLHREDGRSSLNIAVTREVAPAKVPSYTTPRDQIGLPEVAEVDVVRHFTRLSLESHGVDSGPYPLGSCTMKYNPKQHDVLASLPGFASVHPAQPEYTLQGLWCLYDRLQKMICEITGMDACSLLPAAGAHGELAGLLAVKAYYADKGECRNLVLIPDSAHGTNPASAAMAGFECRIIPTDERGRLDLRQLREMLSDRVALLMMTNPSTLGLFEDRIVEISHLMHSNGALMYFDGANLNALMGIVRPGDMGFDVAHINVHKTFSTPHGGGGPGAGPLAVKLPLSKYLPPPVAYQSDDGSVAFASTPARTLGRLKRYHGHVGVLIRAYAYFRAMGAGGLRQASEYAVLNANYLQARLAEMLPPVYPYHCKHETLLSGSRLKTSARQFAKRLIDYGVHPPTIVGAGCVYFPGELKSAMLIEPTETETKESLDAQVAIFKAVFDEDEREAEQLISAPITRRVARIDTN